MESQKYKIEICSKRILEFLQLKNSEISAELSDYVSKRIENLIDTLKTIQEDVIPNSDSILLRLEGLLRKAELVLQKIYNGSKKKGFMKIFSVLKNFEQTKENLKAIFDNISACILDLSTAITARNIQLADSIKMKQKDIDEKLGFILERLGTTNLFTPDETLSNNQTKQNKHFDLNILNTAQNYLEGKASRNFYPKELHMPTLDEMDWGKSKILVDENQKQVKPTLNHHPQKSEFIVKLEVVYLEQSRPSFLSKGRVFEFSSLSHLQETKKVTFGRQSKGFPNPDILFPMDDKSVSRLQCSLKLTGPHLHLTCSSKNSPTLFRVEETPYQLYENMIIEIGVGNNFVIESVYPDYPKLYQSDIMKTNHGEIKHLKFSKSRSAQDEEKKEEEIEEMDRTLPRSQSQGEAILSPQIKIRSLSKNEIFEFKPERSRSFTIGSSETDSYKIQGKGVMEQHCLITYSSEEFWTISSLNRSLENSGTFIYLRNLEEYQTKVEEAYPHRITRGMTFYCGFTGFRVL